MDLKKYFDNSHFLIQIRAMRSSLLDPSQVVRLSIISPLQSTFHIAFEWASIVALAMISESCRNIWIYFFCVILIGARYHALAVMGHDGNHNLLYKRRSWNRIAVVTLLMWPNAAAIQEFKNEHLEHHRFLGTEKDPDFHRLSNYPEFQFPMKLRNFLLVLAMDLTGINFF